ncbi:high mobility group protein dsp1 [Anaeramoeba flamelloides]|uniref:High mobility group protein dsp1 n=1 Tax=Anaeramoeba flamelloides TaxID=1746091 RepID=A0ABQ8Y0E0_9EUKA|nr:high mobility group protein dsp1 [Anaeramoeba flamelloides]
MSRKKSDSDIEKSRPKGRLTSFMIFNKEVNPKVRKEFPQMTFTEISKECSKRWRSLTEKEKQVYINKSEKDKIRYERAMNEFLNRYPDAARKKPAKLLSGLKTRKKDPNKPKRVRTSYQFYSSAVWKDVKNEYPDYGTGGISKEIGKRWRRLPEKEKEKYVRKSDQDKIRFEKELKEFNGKHKGKSGKKESRHKKGKRRDKRRSRKERRRSRDRSRSRRDPKRHHRRHSHKHRRHRYSSSSSSPSSYTGSSSSGYPSSNSESISFTSSSTGSYTSDSFSD